MGEPSWDHWQSFLAVVEAGSLSGAARALGLTQPTLGRHVAQLEAALGVALFARNAQGLQPTPAARALLGQARRMRFAAEALRREAGAAAEGARGVVRLTASEIVGGVLLPPLLARFRAAHPGIAVELVLSNDSDDLLHREADIAVRMFRPRQRALKARKLGEAVLGLYAHPDYLAARGTPVAPDALAGHVMIGPDSRFDGMMLGGRALRREDFALRSDSDLAQLALVRAGAGIGVVQAAVAQGLVRVLPAEAVRLEVWLAMHEDMADARVLRLIWDAVAAGLAPVLR